MCKTLPLMDLGRKRGCMKGFCSTWITIGELQFSVQMKTCDNSRSVKLVYMDGTFKVCSSPYNQVLVIMGDFHGFMIPFVHVLMENKTVGAYRQVLQRIKRLVRRLAHQAWAPHRVITDFEVGLQTAVQNELPATTISGCYFHFTQALWRKIQDLGLSGPYRQKQRLKGVFRKVMAFGYLPQLVMRMNFKNLTNERRTRRLINQYPALMDFFAYVRHTYVGQHGHEATFPPDVWNVFQRNMNQRTNNHLEGECVYVNNEVSPPPPFFCLFPLFLPTSTVSPPFFPPLSALLPLPPSLSLQNLGLR